MPEPVPSQPDTSALRVALWRALHLEVDAPPPVFEDTLALRLADPAPDWRQRPDMHPQGTRGYRAAIVGRARFVEDWVLRGLEQGLGQYVILGAGLDSFALRRPELAERLRVFEVDQPGTQAWKRGRLRALGLAEPAHLRWVPVDFEAGERWWEALETGGFDPGRPALFASTGVSMYLSAEANQTTLRRIAGFAPGTTLALTFVPPLELLDPVERPQHQAVYERARAAGTPFLSFYRPETLLALAREAGFSQARHVSRAEMIELYFRDRGDGLQPASGEEFLVATV